MTLGQDEAVAVGPIRPRRIEPQHFAVEHRDDVGDREARSRHGELPPRLHMRTTWRRKRERELFGIDHSKNS